MYRQVGKEDVDVELLNNLYKSLKTYYNTLFNTGYRKYPEVYKLLVYDFITELLTGDLRMYITESDYRKIMKALSCLYGSSCLISYPSYLTDNSMFGNTFSDSVVRITEMNNNIRLTEDEEIRIKM